MSSIPTFQTVRDALYWACADFATLQSVNNGDCNLDSVEDTVCSYYNRLKSNAISVQDVLGVTIPYSDSTHCIYCGHRKPTSVDHIIPQYYGGREHQDNLAPCCKTCNTSKSNKDLLIWASIQHIELTIEVIQRYLKQLIPLCLESNIMDLKLDKLTTIHYRFAPAIIIRSIDSLYPGEKKTQSCTITLDEAISSYISGGSGMSLHKHFNACGIITWEDLTEEKIIELHDYLLENLSPSSAKTYTATIAALLSKIDSSLIPCQDYRRLLYIGRDQSTIVTLTEDELSSLEIVPIKSEKEFIAKSYFLVECKTGITKDEFTHLENISYVDGHLYYQIDGGTIQKSISCDEETYRRIKRLQQLHQDISRTSLNEAIRRLAQRAGINNKIEVRRKGEIELLPKFQFLSSRNAKYTFKALYQVGKRTRDSPIFSQSRISQFHTHSLQAEVRDRINAPDTVKGSVGISSAIKRRLMELNLSITEVAKSVKMSPDELNDILNAKYPISIKTLERIFWLLKIEL